MTAYQAYSSFPMLAMLPRFFIAAALLWTNEAAAFPLLDASNLDQVPHGTELAAPDAQDLLHQMRLANGLSAPVGGGWTFVPRIDWQEELTDNALQQHTPRQADLVSYFSPGFSLGGDLPRLQLSLDFSPTLAIYARTSRLNSLTEQLNGLGSVTLMPDLVYVDVRALAGVHNEYGGLGGLGTVGAPAGIAATSQTTIPTLAGNGQGLNRDNAIQTSSFGISPYMLRRFGDWGTAKVGYSADLTQSSALSGFAASPFPASGGGGTQTLSTNEEIAKFTTGDFMQYFQDSISVDLQQTQLTTGAGVINGDTGLPTDTKQHATSTREIFTNQISYQTNRALTVFASGGHEDIRYSGFNAPSIHGLTWSLGGTWTPSPDSAVTLSYGRQNGFNSLTVSGHYALSARTMLTLTYGSALGTQLENVRNQLNLATTSADGTLVNAQTGGGQLFGTTNALDVQSGVFRTTTLTVGSQTMLDRDIISIDLLMVKQTGSGGTNASTLESKNALVSWLHQMRPDMTVSVGVSYAIQDQGTGVVSAFNPGDNTSIATSMGWQWQISDTVGASLRYAFFKRKSAVAAFDLYQNVLILGLSKTF